MKKRILAFLSVACILQSCSNENTEQTTEAVEAPKASRIEQLSWVLGTWQLNTPEVNITEIWNKADDNSYAGHTYVVSTKGDTVYTESLQLVAENDTLYYVPSVSNQNGGKPVRFKEKSITGNEVVFENLAHDFPQRIVYQKTSDTSVYAYVEGMQNGKARKEEFPYTRKN